MGRKKEQKLNKKRESPEDKRKRLSQELRLFGHKESAKLLEADGRAGEQELLELRELKARMERLVDAYEANAKMLESKVLVEDGLLDIMSLCSRSAAKMIRASLSGEDS